MCIFKNINKLKYIYLNTSEIGMLKHLSHFWVMALSLSVCTDQNKECFMEKSKELIDLN